MLAAGLLLLRAVASLPTARIIATAVGILRAQTVLADADISRVQVDVFPVEPASASRVEGARARLKRLVERGWLVEEKPGRFMLPAQEQDTAGAGRPGGGSLGFVSGGEGQARTCRWG